MQPVHQPDQHDAASAAHAGSTISALRQGLHGRSLALFSVASALILLAGCGNTYRPVVAAVSPVGPAAQPSKFAVAISSTGATTPGLATLVDFAGDTVLNTTSIGVNPQYLILDSAGANAFVLDGDGTANAFAVSSALINSKISQITLPQGASPVAALPTSNNLYIAEPALGQTAQFTEALPPSFKQQLPTGMNSLYTVGVASAPRVYAISQGTAGSAGSAAAIETSTNTLSNQIAVGRGPVYGIMDANAFRAYILNRTDGTVSVINAQKNALDTFNVTSTTSASTIPVGVNPVWADFAVTRAEMVVANAGNGTTPGTLTIVNIPLCVANTINVPNCDPANPVDANGFGQVLANVTVGVNPVMVTVLSDGSRAYVANAGNAALGIQGSVSVVNLDTNTVTATIPAGPSGNEGDLLIHGHPGFIASSLGAPTGKVYVTASDSTDLTIIRTDTDSVNTHLTLQGTGVMVRVTAP